MTPARAALLLCAPITLIASTASRPDRDAERTFTVPLSGQAEAGPVHPVGGSGDPDGSGLVRLSVDPAARRLCYDFTLAGVATPLMAHIHRGPEFGNGPTVVTLFTGPGGELSDCLDWTPKWLAAIIANPSSFYVNVATTEFPDGAVRGQLRG